jgi:hypothetical protein
VQRCVVVLRTMAVAVVSDPQLFAHERELALEALFWFNARWVLLGRRRSACSSPSPAPASFKFVDNQMLWPWASITPELVMSL